MCCRTAIGALLLLPHALCGCDSKSESSGLPTVSVTNTYLASAVRDLCGDSVQVFCLAPPGMCPGHFDLTPEQFRRLLDSKRVLRFDFQQNLDSAVQRIRERVVSIQGRTGLCIPQTYLETCREVTPSVEGTLVSPEALQARFAALEARLERLSEIARSRVRDAGLEGTKVLVAHHQSAFAEWLGLEVVGTFRNAEVMTPGEIEACLAAARQGEARLVIANLQEGSDLARNMARTVGARLVVFSNFPDTRPEVEHAFDHLVLSNVDHLLDPQDP